MTVVERRQSRSLGDVVPDELRLDDSRGKDGRLVGLLGIDGERDLLTALDDHDELVLALGLDRAGRRVGGRELLLVAAHVVRLELQHENDRDQHDEQSSPATDDAGAEQDAASNERGLAVDAARRDARSAKPFFLRDSRKERTEANPLDNSHHQRLAT